MYLLFVVILLFSTFILYQWWFKNISHYDSLKHIPGPKPLQFIGSALIMGSTPQEILHSFRIFTKQYGAIYKLIVGLDCRLVISDSEIIEQIVSSNEHITKSNSYHLLRSWLGDGLITSKGEKWKQRRKLLMPCFHFTILQKFLATFTALADEFVTKLENEVGEKRSFDILPYVKSSFLMLMCESAMGLKIDSQQALSFEYIKAVEGFLQIFISRVFSLWKRHECLFKLSPDYKAYKYFRKVLHRFAQNIIVQRRKEIWGGNFEINDVGLKSRIALLDFLLNAGRENLLEDIDIADEMNTFLFAGHDATGVAFGYVVLMLSKHQDIQQKVLEEIIEIVGVDGTLDSIQTVQSLKYLDCVIKESLRLYPPVPLLERLVENELRIGDTKIPAKTIVTLNVISMHHNAKHFPEPGKFDPSRFFPDVTSKRHNYCYLPFSAGPRNCIGQKFGMLAMKVFTVKMLLRYKILPVEGFQPELGITTTLKSFNGIQGDLGAIDEKYDIAISTACGPLDNIVVDHVDTAEWCIQFLKSRDIGRATFIALNKQEYLSPQAEGKIKTPENVHRLYDLIRVQDDRVKTAFYYALRDTLVADDLDQAGRIAYGSQRYRVVTLKGEIIEISGTMSGGGRTMLKGRMGRTRGSGSMIVSPKEIENMQRDIDESNHRLRTLTDQQTQLDRQIAALEPELQTMKCNLAKFVKDLQEAKEALPMLTKQLKQQEAIAQSTKSDGKQVEKLTKVVDDTKSKYQDASAVAQKIQEKCDAAKNEIEARTNSKMKQVNKNLSDVTKTIEKIKADLVKFRVEIANSKRNCERSEAKIASLEESITDAERTLKEMAAEKEVIETDAKKLLEHVEKLTDELLQGEEEFGDLKREVAAFVAQEKAIAFEKLDVDQAFKTVNEKLQEHTGGINHWRGKLSQLKLHDIPNEQQREELQTFTEEELESRNTEAAELELNAAETYIRAAKPNLNILQEYRKGHAVFVERSNELEQVTEKRNDMKALHDKVKEQRKDEFMVGYTTIKTKLKEMYQMITLGGDADFEIVDTFDPFSEGIQFNVRPPKKSWKVISNLSGGEKTLSSLALVFALHYYKPSPLYVMDEIDAALDFKNVSIVGQYIKDRTKNAQFIIISLRSNMFELCDNLVGIYKIFNCTQSITINPKGFHKKNAKKDEQVVPSGRTQNAPNRDASFDELRHNVAGPSTRKSQEIVPVATHESRLESQSTESMEENEEFDEDHVVEDSLAGSSQSSQGSEQL